MLLTGAGGAVSNVLASVPWVAQWKFNNDGNDSIGANNLTNNNSATFTDGKLGGATGATQLVAASSQYWSIADNAALSTGDVDFTICAWVYLDSETTFAIISKDNGTASNDFRCDYDAASHRFRFFICNASSVKGIVSATTFGPPSTATWYCVIGWHNATLDTVNISINDGDVDSAATTGVPIAGESSVFVGWVGGGINYLNGRLDNVCFAKSAAGAGGVLTAAQRTAFYLGGVGTETLT